ncbi:hypothetical protein BH09PLA1_BH09PLA1_10320 [soil metagenome]
MSHGFLPRTDAGLIAWSRNLLAKIQDSFEQLGLSLPQVEAYQQLHESFAAKLQLCAPQIRNKVSVAQKNASRAALKADAVRLKNIINGQTNVSDAQKTELGLNVRKSPTAKAAPDSAPLLSVSPAQGQNTVRVQLAQAEAARRGRPQSALGAMSVTFIGDEAPSDVSAWRFHALASSTSIDITFDASLAPGTKVWVTANWFGTRKQTGPMAAPIYTHLFGGGVAMSAMKLAA